MTKIVYCKKEGRNLKGHPVQFDFLGFSFQPVRYQLRKGGSFLQYDCKMSRKSKVRITQGLEKLDFHNKTQRGIQDLATLLNQGYQMATASYTIISWPVLSL
jgi:hypothetical protein